MYWFSKAGEMLRAGMPRAGLVATNSIRGGANRARLKKALVGNRIFDAWDDEEWTIEGAAVRVSLVCMDWEGDPMPRLDGLPVEEIYPDLTAREIDGATVDLDPLQRRWGRTVIWPSKASNSEGRSASRKRKPSCSDDSRQTRTAGPNSDVLSTVV